MKIQNAIIIILFLVLSCSNDKAEVKLDPVPKAVEAKEVQKKPENEPLGIGDHKARIIRTLNHSKSSFTQGLYFLNNKLYESTGQYGSSKLNVIDAFSGAEITSKSLGFSYFGEGLTILNNRIYVLTWKRGICFVYDLNSQNEIGRFNYEGEGWGLTDNGEFLIMSDGTSVLKFIDPNSFAVIKRVFVSDNGEPKIFLNELEYVNGEIFANIWGEEIVVRIDPETGNVLGKINLDFLKHEVKFHNDMDVLNGIAYDPIKNTFYATGKNWDSIFELELYQD